MTDEELTVIYNQANGITVKQPSLSTERIFTAMRAMIPIARATLEAENTELRKDAERWDWARKHPTWLGWEHDFRPDEVDAAIDAALKETP